MWETPATKPLTTIIFYDDMNFQEESEFDLLYFSDVSTNSYILESLQLRNSELSLQSDSRGSKIPVITGNTYLFVLAHVYPDSEVFIEPFIV